VSCAIYIPRGHKGEIARIKEGVHPQGLLLLLLLVILASQRQLFLHGVLELDVLEVVQVLHDVLVHRLGEVDHLQVFGQQLL